MLKHCVLFATFLISGCFSGDEDNGDEPQPIRGLITVLVDEAEQSTIRRYPGVLEPAEVNTLSFKLGGRMGRIALDVGERVQQGQLLTELEPEQFETQIEKQQAAVQEAEATLAQAEADLTRSETLLARGAGTRVQRDEYRTEVSQSRARLAQAKQDLASANEDLVDAKLHSPVDGIVDSIEVESFATVSAGQTVLTIYQQASYEVSFSVSFDVVSQLVVGTPATIRLADDPSVELQAIVSELGERAGQVASFPVVVKLEGSSPIIKAGMAVEVSFEFSLPALEGHLIPISAAIPDVDVPEDAGPTSITDLEVFVFVPATSTVERRRVTMAGIRENQFLVIDGLQVGERVATKGVTFLREGMEVRLLNEDVVN